MPPCDGLCFRPMPPCDGLCLASAAHSLLCPLYVYATRDTLLHSMLPRRLIQAPGVHRRSGRTRSRQSLFRHRCCSCGCPLHPLHSLHGAEGLGLPRPRRRKEAGRRGARRNCPTFEAVIRVLQHTNGACNTNIHVWYTQTRGQHPRSSSVASSAIGTSKHSTTIHMPNETSTA